MYNIFSFFKLYHRVSVFTTCTIIIIKFLLLNEFFNRCKFSKNKFIKKGILLRFLYDYNY